MIYNKPGMEQEMKIDKNDGLWEDNYELVRNTLHTD